MLTAFSRQLVTVRSSMPISSHSHSGQFCSHAKGTLQDVVASAVRKGFKFYGLTEHMPRYRKLDLYPEEIKAKLTPTDLVNTYTQFVAEARRLQRETTDISTPH
jgi:histidinol-phosphatase (PHP family)